MKLNPNQPALVLDFTKLQGSAREALSATLQGFLIVKLGFHWESDKERSKPLHLNADAIIVNSGDGCPVSLRQLRNGQLASKPQTNAKYFDVTTEHDEFLDALQNLLPKTVEEALDLLETALNEFRPKRREVDESPVFSRN